MNWFISAVVVNGLANDLNGYNITEIEHGDGDDFLTFFDARLLLWLGCRFS